MYLTKLYMEPSHLLDPDLREQHEEMETMLETYLDTMRGTCNRLQLMLREVHFLRFFAFSIVAAKIGTSMREICFFFCLW